MIERDDNLKLYAVALFACFAAVVGSFFLQRPVQDWAAIRVDAEALGAIETASIPRDVDPAGPEAWGFPTIPWRSYEDGMIEMARSGRSAVVVLQADWCLTCRTYQAQFLTSEIEQFADEFVFILVDIDDEPDLQLRYDVDGDYIPRTFLLTADGGLAETRTGTDPNQRFFVDPDAPGELAALLARN